MRDSFYFLMIHIGLMLLFLVCIISYGINFNTCVIYNGYDAVVCALVFDSLCFLFNAIFAVKNLFDLRDIKKF